MVSFVLTAKASGSEGSWSNKKIIKIRVKQDDRVRLYRNDQASAATIPLAAGPADPSNPPGMENAMTRGLPRTLSRAAAREAGLA
ncbi:MAG: hypothetical protein E5V71_14330, partial [Mesorhizobium sp.]